MIPAIFSEIPAASVPTPSAPSRPSSRRWARLALWVAIASLELSWLWALGWAAHQVTLWLWGLL